MNNSTLDFSLKVDGVEGICPAGEKHAIENITEGKIPILSCEGPCIRGEIARLAANIVAKESPYARACYAEAFLVPHSSMTRWVKEADRVVMIDGCFLTCLGRVLKNFIDEGRIIHIDVLPLHKKYGDVFLYTDVSEAERTEVAQEVADKILTMLKEERVSAK
ncbi:MAG: putative zinc-binding protein [Planctomycetota bacterium]|jgi:uncharacterized metal-binding protein